MLHWKLAVRLSALYACFAPKSACAAIEAALSDFLLISLYISFNVVS